MLCAWHYQALRDAIPCCKDDYFKFYPILVQVREPGCNCILTPREERKRSMSLCLVPYPKQWSKRCSSLGQIMGLHHLYATLNILCKAESREAATVETFKAEQKAEPNKTEKEW